MKFLRGIYDILQKELFLVKSTSTKKCSIKKYIYGEQFFFFPFMLESYRLKRALHYFFSLLYFCS